MRDIIIKGDFDALYENNSNVPFEIEFSNPKHHGLSAKLRIRHTVEVQDSDPENVDNVMFEQQFMIATRTCRVDVPSNKFPEFEYDGTKIEIGCQAEVVVDDAIFFDTKERLNIPLKRLRPSTSGLSSNPGEELDPDDKIHFARNFAALSLKQKIAWIWAFGTFILATIGNFLLALFDTFVASIPILYSGDVDIGLFGAGAGVFGGGIAFVAINKKILSSYKNAKLVTNLPTISKGMSYRMADFFIAKSSVNLEGVTLRLVVANLECGQYWRGSGTDRNRVSFAHPSRAFVLFEKTVHTIPKGMGIEAYFNERLNLDKAFESLRPQQMITNTHGLKIKTEIQIMVADLADTHLELPSSVWNRDDFTNTHHSEDNF